MSKMPGNSKNKSKKDKWSNNPFRGLKKALEEKGVSPVESPKVPGPDKGAREIEGAGPPGSVTPVSDEELFLKAMEEVREIGNFRKMDVQPQPPKFVKHSKDEDPYEQMRRVIEQDNGITISDMDEYDEWVPPGGRSDLVKRLHRGECSVQDYIDLHGLIQDEAEAALVDFLEGSRREGFSCVKVIHGRGLRSPGEPVLKLMVSRLLKGALSKHVRAYATAPPKDGGLGATYVLLKGK